MTAKNQKLFGKWNELILLIIGFLLTTLVGSIISFWVQNRSWDHQYEQTLLQSEKQKAENVFTQLSSLMDNRLYTMRRILWGYDSELTNDEINIRWDDYVEVLKEWNINLNKNLALIQIYFGAESRNIFEYKIHHKLRAVGSLMEDIKTDKRLDNIEKAKKGLDPINVQIYQFDLLMLEQISNENIGRFKNKRLVTNAKNP